MVGAPPPAGEPAPRLDDPVELSVVIPVRDAAAVVPDQLGALRAQRWEGHWEVVVALDAGSADATADVVGRYADGWPRLRIVDAPPGGGPGSARNVGAAAAAGSALAFCDADDVVAPGWVAAMGDALRHHEFVTGPLELDRLNPTWLVESRGRSFADRRPVYEGIFPYASSCNLGVRRPVFERAGGFDAAWRVGEDIELSMRLWLSGIVLHFEPGAVVHYRYRPTLRSTYRQARSYGRVRPLLAERLRRAGRPAPNRSAGLRNWAWLVRHVRLLAGRPGRAKWLWVAGQRVGSLEGSWRVRRLYP
ncbi:MAG TPA: glycosyltransferase [Acidimicrobiia bacterium]|nr:glycosyltransferase [Acidimicrobiia bacterium]